MKFQDSSLNSLKVRVGTKKCDPRTHAPTHPPKAICPTNFFNVGGIDIYRNVGNSENETKLITIFDISNDQKEHTYFIMDDVWGCL